MITLGECFFSTPYVRCIRSTNYKPYHDAMLEMDQLFFDVYSGAYNACLWFLEHNDVYTAGASAPDNYHHDISVIKSDRGGKYTYHGPGQLILYPILNLHSLYSGKPDIRKFVSDITTLVIISLTQLGIQCFSDPENIGIWTMDYNNTPKKIASIGLKVKKWISYHGIAINISTDLNKFKAISPCGLSPDAMTSLCALGFDISINDVITSLVKNFLHIFNIPYEGDINLQTHNNKTQFGDD